MTTAFGNLLLATAAGSDRPRPMATPRADAVGAMPPRRRDEGCGYRRQGPHRRIVVAVVALHVGAVAVLVAGGRHARLPAAPEPMLVVNLASPAPPPPPVAAPPEATLLPVPVDVPLPAIEVASAAVPISATAITAAPVAAPVASAPATAPALAVAAAAPAPAAPADLAATLIEGRPPAYPYESRRRHEEGTVVLAVTLAPDGRPAAIEVHQSSGFDRLDRAARDAVRGWRWRPQLAGGVAVAVRGIVEIPFRLQRGR